jgi:YD repeat-containing protein
MWPLGKYHYTCYITDVPIQPITDSTIAIAGFGFTPTNANSFGCVPDPAPDDKVNGCPIVSAPGAPGGGGLSGGSVGNPVGLTNGDKHETVVDFSTAGPHALRFVRSHDGLAMIRSDYNAGEWPLGGGWRSNFDLRLWQRYSGTNYSEMHTYRADGKRFVFTETTGGNYATSADIPLKLFRTGSSFELTDIDDTVETYNLSGKLLSIRTRRGYLQTLTYDSNGKLSSVVDSYGRSLTFGFTGNRLTSMLAPDGSAYHYIYDQAQSYFSTPPDRLVQVKYPRPDAIGSGPQPQITYHYEDTRFPWFLTGATDEKGVRYATWAYDDAGRATLSEHAGGADQHTIAYGVDGSRTVTNALGKQSIYRFTTVQGSRRISAVEGQASANCLAANAAYTYDANGYPASTTDWKGNVTTYVYNSRGLETSRIEAYGTHDCDRLAQRVPAAHADRRARQDHGLCL